MGMIIYRLMCVLVDGMAKDCNWVVRPLIKNNK